MRSKPYTDKDINMPVCYRCMNSNPLTNLKGDKCNTCSHPFVRSPISYDILPLIEFQPDKEIDIDRAMELIRMSPEGALKAATMTE
jgi:intraflagellar transport protein 122